MTQARPVSADALRSAYLAFFQERGHVLMPSASLVPAGDPTLLLTSAGMVPFKPYFMGDEEPPGRRLVSVQKCFRTTDIDAVGDDTHLTFFEMLGNFSIGDYFKKEAIAWAWEFSTEVLRLPPERIWVTVYLDDDEAFGYWSRDIGVLGERIVRFGEEDNYWGPAGSEGPCGPCSELHYDLHPDRGMNGEKPNDGSGRFVEFWNLVFMQFYQHPDGSRVPLPAPNIDTGMGLDRTVAILQGVASVYDTDLMAPLVSRVAELSGKHYGQNEADDYAIRVVAEHGRSATFLIADGVVPGNEGRGYVLRRVVRRALRFGRKLGMEGQFLAQVAEAVTDRMGLVYPELVQHRRFVLRALEQEEERFAQALAEGGPLLGEIVRVHGRIIEIVDRVGGLRGRQPDSPLTPQQAARAIGEVSDAERAGPVGELLDPLFQTARRLVLVSDSRRSLARVGRLIPGPAAFYLYDTHGFPLELTQEIAGEHGLEVDEKGFQEQMDAQRERGRAASSFAGDRDVERTYEAMGVHETPFLGYGRLDSDTVVVGLLAGGALVDSASLGQEVEVVLRETPFYPEGGGQVGDSGVIHHAGGRLTVRDTQSRPAGTGSLIVHYAEVTEGAIAVGNQVRAEVDAQRRADVMRSHSATHLLHQALRQVLGAHVRQAGSLVAPDYLRFDFTHVGPVSPDELTRVQQLVNDVIRRDLLAEKRETTYREAMAGGALAFFGERYPDRVRVLEIGDFSYEVCGGTHVDRSGQIGTFRITNETGIGSGLRRIEAVTGRGADAWIDERSRWLDEVSKQLQVPPAEASQRLTNLLDEMERARRVLTASRRDASLKQVESLLHQVRQVNGVPTLAAQVSSSSAEALREMGDWLRDKMGSGIVALGSVFNDRPSVVVMVTPDLVDKGYRAGDIAKAAARQMGGGGGGRPELAQAGGREASQLPAALEAVVESLGQRAE